MTDLEGTPIDPRPADTPSLAEQVTRLYDLIGGYHATNLVEIGRELGIWEALAADPGLGTAELAARLGIDPAYTDTLCVTALAFGIVERDGDGWRMAPHFDTILGDPTAAFYLGRAARVHMVIGEDYADYPARFRTGERVPFDRHGERFVREVGDALKTLPRIFVDVVLPRLGSLAERLDAGVPLLEVGCGSGHAIVELARRFPNISVVGVDPEPISIALAQERIAEAGLGDRCSARLIGAEGLGDVAAFDVATAFLVVHEIPPEAKDDAFRAVAQSLRAGGYFVIFDEAMPETDDGLRRMPGRFGAVAQWFELTWGNVIDTRSTLVERCERAGLRVIDETSFSRFLILVAEKG
jgi:SAM-dependent methyltransferase